jgi:hypothetical protein
MKNDEARADIEDAASQLMRVELRHADEERLKRFEQELIAARSDPRTHPTEIEELEFNHKTAQFRIKKADEAEKAIDKEMEDLTKS